jgi:3-isopropylmalate/(R)-2-methylmalate dehydratase large subunit
MTGRTLSNKTLFDKIWDQHVVADLGDGYALLHVDRHLLHDLGGGRAVLEIAEKGYRLRNPGLTFATPDHAISSTPGRADTSAVGRRLLEDLRTLSRDHGVRLFDVGEPGQGIVHVIGPELGLTLPGTLLVCGDSHTCTHGGMGALAFGIGTSEVTHVLATQCLVQRRPRRLRITFEGNCAPGVTPKDMILYVIGKIGAAGGNGSAVEYAGAAVRALEIEGRLTLCNLSIELGAKIGMVAPDDKTYAFLADRPFAPKGALWDQAVAQWRTLPSDDDAGFDHEEQIDVAEIAPQITWGTSPEMVIAVDQRIPDPASFADSGKRRGRSGARLYGLGAGRADRRHQGRLGVHRLLHQQPHLRSARRRRDSEARQGRAACPCLGGARLGECEAPGRGRGPRSHLH